MIKFEEGSNLFEDWKVPQFDAYPDFHYNEGRKLALEFLKIAYRNKTSKKLHWFDPYRIKHDVEHWRSGNPKHYYVSRDIVTAGAIFLGIPVQIDPKNHRNNRVGLYMTKRQYSKFCEKMRTDLKFWLDQI